MTTGNSCLQMTVKKYVMLKTAWTLEAAIKHGTYWQNLHAKTLRLKWIHVYRLLILAIMTSSKPLQVKLWEKLIVLQNELLPTVVKVSSKNYAIIGTANSTSPMQYSQVMVCNGNELKFMAGSCRKSLGKTKQVSSLNVKQFLPNFYGSVYGTYFFGNQMLHRLHI